MNRVRWATYAAVAALTISLSGASALAQQPPAAPVPKAAPKAAPKAKAKAPTKSASACRGLEQKACTAKAECNWIAATTRKDGKQVKAYCRTKPKSAKAATKS